MSALTSKADIDRWVRNVRFEPTADICSRFGCSDNKLPTYTELYERIRCRGAAGRL